jgi:calcineurin-like phosphoesterase family protein
MRNIYVFSDPHFGDHDMLDLGIRKFDSIEDHDEYIITQVTSVVRPQDHLYVLGDIAMKPEHILTAKRLNGHKRLVRGNHDIYPTLDYIYAGFKEIFGVRVFSELNLVLSHIPLHPDSVIVRKWTNIHGHLHEAKIDSEFYRNVCLEHLPDYRPIQIR